MFESTTGQASSISPGTNPLPDIRACTLKRRMIQKLQSTPDFVKTITGCFVRFKENDNFKIAQIVNVHDFVPTSSPDHDHIYDSNGKILDLDDGNAQPLNSISDEPAEESEIFSLLMSNVKGGRPSPSDDHLLRKLAEINAAMSWPLAPNKDIEIANHSTDRQMEDANDEEMPQINGEEDVQNEVISTENLFTNENIEEMNGEYEMEVEISQNQNIGQMSPTNQEVDLVISNDDFKSADEEEEKLPNTAEDEIKQNEIIASTSQFESKTIPIGSQSSYNLNLASDEVALPSMAAEKRKLSQKEKNKQIEQLDELLPVVLTKKQIVEMIHALKFNELAKDCFVRIKQQKELDVPENGENANIDGVEKHFLARIVEANESEKMKVMDSLFYNTLFFVSCPNVQEKLFEINLEEISDNEPMEEEFKNWPNAYPNGKFVMTKKAQLSNCMKRIMRKDGREEWKQINAANEAEFEKQKILSSREEFLQIFLRRSEILRLVKQKNFGPSVIGGFVRFLYNVPFGNGQSSSSTAADFKVKYKIMQIVGIQPIEGGPYEFCQQIVDKNLKLEWDKDKMIENARISSISDSIPKEEEFKEWLQSRMENNHHIPSLQFVKSKSATFKAALGNDHQMEQNEQEKEEKAKPEGKNEEKRFRPKLERRAKLQPNKQNQSAPIQKKNPKKRVSFSATASENSLQKPKGFEILKKTARKRKFMENEGGNYAKAKIAKTPLFWHSLGQLERKMLKENGFGKVLVWVDKEEFNREFLKCVNEKANIEQPGPSTSNVGAWKGSKQPLKIIVKSRAKKGAQIECPENKNGSGGLSTGSSRSATVEVRTGQEINFGALNSGAYQSDIKFPIVLL